MTGENSVNQQENLPSQKASVWKSMGAAALFFSIYMLVQTLIAYGYALYLILATPDGLSRAEQIAWQDAQYYKHGNILMIVIDLCLLAILIAWFAARKQKISPSLGMKKTRRAALPTALVAGIGMSCVLSFLMSLVTQFLPDVMEEYNETMAATYNMRDFLLYTLAGVVGAPLIEELFFRHLIAGRLSEGLPRWVAILLSSAVFGLVHQHPVQWVYAGILGFIMACLYFAYDSVWVPMIFHAGFNSVSLLSYVDLSKLSHGELDEYQRLVFKWYSTFCVLGVAAMILLSLLRTHSVFTKSHRNQQLSALPSMEQSDAKEPFNE